MKMTVELKSIVATEKLSGGEPQKTVKYTFKGEHREEDLASGVTGSFSLETPVGVDSEDLAGLEPFAINAEYVVTIARAQPALGGYFGGDNP